MSLKATIDSDLKTALLAGDRFTAETLRGFKAAVLNEEVAKGLRDTGLADADVEQIAAREVKKRLESAAIYEQNSRDDAADQERREADIIQKYLPEQLSEAELKTVVDAKIAETGATSPQDMGKVIRAVKADVGTAGDSALIARLVRETLTK